MKVIREILLVILALVLDYSLAGRNRTLSQSLPNVTYPFLATLEFNMENEQRFLISGTLLNRYWVLTQATISPLPLNFNAVDYIIVRLGIKDNHNFVSEHTTSEFYIHPRFVPKNTTVAGSIPINDLLLVKLQRPAVLVDGKIKPISLPSRSDINVDMKGFTLRVVGLATSNGTEKSSKPAKTNSKSNVTSSVQRIDFRVLDNHDFLCINERLPTPKASATKHGDLTDGHFCAVSNGLETNEPVLRGAPVLWGPEDEPVLAGVYSQALVGSAQVAKRGVAFSRIAMYLEWIEQTTGIVVADI